MIFKLKQITRDVSIVYGFKNSDDLHYIMVTTLQKKGNVTLVHGLVSKENMTLFEFIALWEYYQNIIETKYLQFEVLPEHARFYKILLPIVKSSKSKTFNGLDCEILKIDINSEVKNFRK